jgi:hypothetical protein
VRRVDHADDSNSVRRLRADTPHCAQQERSPWCVGHPAARTGRLVGLRPTAAPTRGSPLPELSGGRVLSNWRHPGGPQSHPISSRQTDQRLTSPRTRIVGGMVLRMVERLNPQAWGFNLTPIQNAAIFCCSRSKSSSDTRPRRCAPCKTSLQSSSSTWCQPTSKH